MSAQLIRHAAKSLADQKNSALSDYSHLATNVGSKLVKACLSELPEHISPGLVNTKLGQYLS